jgi:hypothetical protein
VEKPVINFTMMPATAGPPYWVALDCDSCDWQGTSGTMELANIFRLEHLLDHVFEAIDSPSFGHSRCR